MDELIKKFFTRTKFLPDPMGSNVLFAFFAQHFTHHVLQDRLHQRPGLPVGRAWGEFIMTTMMMMVAVVVVMVVVVMVVVRVSNDLLAFFAQHFTHMFFKTDFTKGPGFQWGGHGVSSS